MYLKRKRQEKNTKNGFIMRWQEITFEQLARERKKNSNE